MTRAQFTDDGPMMCPNCKDSELQYGKKYPRQDAFKARYDKKRNGLFIIGDPQGTTLNDGYEYLFCSKCKRHFYDEFDQQNTVAHEGDYLRAIKDTSADQCPYCGCDSINFVESYEVTTEISHKERDTNDESVEKLIMKDHHEIEYERGGKNEHLECPICLRKWSIPYNVVVVTE